MEQLSLLFDEAETYVFAEPAEQDAVERAYQVPDPPDRMRHPVRVAYYEIKHEPCRKSDHMCLQQ